MMQFTYLKSVSPVTILDKPSKQTVVFLEKFLAVPEISQAIESVEKQLHTTQKIDIHAVEGKDLLAHPFFQTDYASFLLKALPKQALAQFNVSDDWMMQLVLIMFFDAVIDLEYFQAMIDRKFEFVLGKKNISGRMFEYPQELGAILIPYNSNKQQLKDWIDSNWQDIEEQMDHALIEFQPFLKEYQNLEIGKEIDELKKEKLSYKEISIKLVDKYPNDSRLTDYSNVKKMHHRYLSLVNRLQIQIPHLLTTKGDTNI
jgi:hypothetical protein